MSKENILKKMGFFMKDCKEILLSTELNNIWDSMPNKAVYLHQSLLHHEIDESSEPYEWLKIKTTMCEIKEKFRKKIRISDLTFSKMWEILIEAELVIDNQDGTFTLPCISIR